MTCALSNVGKEEHMSALASLKLSAVTKPTNITPVQLRRNKLAKRLWEQMELAKAQQTGSTFAPIKLRSVRDAETGLRKQVEVNKRVKPWWFVAENGKLAVSVRYGTRVLELGKGKWAVEVGAEKELVPVLEVLKTAVLDGELDAAIETASNKLRSAFGKG
jgi:hypothetical protein